MNIIEAHKSGKAYRRKGDNTFVRHFKYVETLTLTEDDLLTEDWEVEEEKRELSWEEIKRALIQNGTILELGKGGTKVDIDLQGLMIQLGFGEREKI